ncbi:MAG: protein kinase [Thermoleophilia bacterium]|nr:protein kinase [Thermoleophilia bacterium]
MVRDSQLFDEGEALGEFRILGRLGEGGMGVVYLARDERLGRQVALKVIAPQLGSDPEFRERFEAEARSAAAIDHPNVVPIYSAGSHESVFFIAMRFVDGVDLRTELLESGQLDLEVALAVLDDVAAALDAAHEAGLVHRDVKPANILLAGRSNPTVYLTDFGLTKGMQGSGAQLTGTGQWIGSVDYVAPEQMTTGLVDARTDVYALGCVLFEVISGSPPFSGSDMQKMWHQVNEPVRSLSESGRLHPLDPVIARATAKEQDDRYPSAGDLARAARAAIAGTEPTLDEHSVAAGAAAAGMASGGGVDRTRTMRAAIPRERSESATTRMQAPTLPPRAPGHGGGGGVSTRLAALVGACVVLAAGLVVGALVLASGDEGSQSRTVINKSVQTVTTESAPEEAEATESAFEEPAPEPDAVAPSGFTTYDRNLYAVDIPEGWELDEDEVFNGTYYESTWHPAGDAETTILIDSQTPAPPVPAITSAEEVRAQTSQTDGYVERSFESTVLAGLPAARWVFDAHGDRRVDYFVNSCDAGIAVLGSTSPVAFGALAGLFHEVATSVRTDC